MLQTTDKPLTREEVKAIILQRLKENHPDTNRKPSAGKVTRWLLWLLKNVEKIAEDE